MKTNRWMIVPVCILLLTCWTGGVSASSDTDVKAFDHYWKQVQEARADYDDQVGEIQKKYEKDPNNPQAQKQLKEAQQAFEQKRTTIAQAPENKGVAQNPDVEKQYWQQKHQTYKQDSDAAEKRLQAQLDGIRKRYPNAAEHPVARRQIQQATQEYQNRSRELAAEHQKDIQDMVKDEMNKKTQGRTSKTAAPIKTTAGTGLYKKDPDTGKIVRDSEGKPVLNPSHRGTEGDYDGEAGHLTADPDSVKTILKAKGLGDVSVEDRPGYVTIGDGKDGLNITLNKGGESMGEPGSSGHEAKVTTDAQSKETYVSVAMKEGQPGRSYVEVQDHKKKAMKGLKTDPAKLVRDSDALQGLAKGTSKSIASADLSDDDLRKVIKDNDLQETPRSLRRKLSRLKEGQAKAPDGVGIHEGNMGKYQKACQDIIDTAESKAAAKKDADIADAKKEIKKLAGSDDPADKKKAADLRKQLADTNVRSKLAREANEKREKGEDLTPPPTTKRRPESERKTAGSDESKDKKGTSESDENGTDKGRTKSAYSGISEDKNLAGGTTTEEHSGKTVAKKDGSEVTTTHDKTTKTGLTGSSSEETKTTTTTQADGSQKTTSKTDSEQKGLLAGNSKSTSTTESESDASGSKSKTTSSTTEKDTFTTKTTQQTTTTTTTPDGAEKTTGQKSETTSVGGKPVVNKETESESSSQTHKVNVVDNDGNVVGKGSVKTGTSHETETTKIGDTTVGKKHTIGGEAEGKFNRDEADKPTKAPPAVKVNIKIADNVEVKEDASSTHETGGATKVGDAEFSGNIKAEFGHTKSQVGTTITVEPDGSVKVEGIYHKEANLVKISGGGKATGKVGDAEFGLEGKGEVKVGAEFSAKGDVSAGPDGVKAHGEIDIFAGMKAEGELSASADLNEYVGISVKGTMKGEVSVGVGIKGTADAELSWTKVKISGSLAGALGLGTGGSATVEIDGSVLITGVNLAKVAESDKKSAILAAIIKKTKTGQMKLPNGKKWKDIIPDMDKKIEWIVKHPQLVKKGEEADAIMKAMEFEKGKGKGKYVSVKKNQKDWYCTNRPQIKAPVKLPPVVHGK